MKAMFRVFFLFLLFVAYFVTPQISAQDWVHTGTNLGNERIRLAAADFKPVGSDPETTPLKATFDSTLYNDLSNAGIFDMVSKSLAPQSTPGGERPAGSVGLVE
jgi:TolB protein